MSDNAPTKIQHAAFNDDEIDLWELAAALWKRKLLIIVIALISGTATFGYLKTQPDLYRSTVTILPLKDEGENAGALGALALLAGGSTPSANNGNSDIELILDSRSFKEDLIRNYDLMPKLFKTEQLSSEKPPHIEYQGAGTISKMVGFSSESNGVLKIDVLTEDPQLSLDMCNYIIELLRDYIATNVYTSSKRYRELVDLRLKTVKEELKNLKNIRNEEFSMMLQMKQEAYLALFQAQEKARLEEIKNAIHFEVIDPALLPLSPAKPNRKLITLIALVAGGFLGIFLAILLEAIDNRKKLQTINA